MPDDPSHPPGAAAPPPAADAPRADGWVDLPEPQVDRTRRFSVSLVWIVPLIALLVGASLLVRNVLMTGPRIEIEFASAESIEPGKTQVRYKEVVIGKVEAVQLSDDRKRVVVTVQLDRSAAGMAVEDTAFWVVRTRIGTSGVSGLGTLFSGAYIGADAGTSTKTRTRFVGLEAPPLVLRGEPGAVFVLRAEDLGSLDVGSSVFHRRTRVGRVVGYTLDPARDELSVKIFVEAPFEALVTTGVRFWNASGVDLSINASGLTLNTQTLASVIVGGLSFEVPPDMPKGTPAPPGSVFTLYDDRRTALAPEAGPPLATRMVFDQSTRGLEIGAPIDFLGVEIGRVRSLALQFDPKRERFPVEVLADIYPLRLGAVRTALVRAAPGRVDPDLALLQRLVDNGLRAQLRNGNLLTGQLYVALDFMPQQAGREIALKSVDGAITLPTVPGTLNELQQQIADIVQKISKVPFDAIGVNLLGTLKSANATIEQLAPEARKTLAEVQRTLARAQATFENLDRNVTDASSPVQRNLEDTLLELQRTASALRVLAEYLQLHPESLLRGKPADPVVEPRGGRR